MKLNLPTILSFNGGYVDTAGFLALHGLFTAHVTGNFVTIGDALVHGRTGLVSKLLALPMFCLTVLILQLIALRVAARPERALPVMLAVQVVFLALGAMGAIRLGPVFDADGSAAIMAGMLLVAGMAIQNAAHRLYLPSAPPSTLMTGSTTQIMLDLGALLSPVGKEEPGAVKVRLARLALAVVSFALGCAAAALAYVAFGAWCFVLPPLVMLAGLVVYRGEAKPG